ncbi:MAG: hypothetical protein KDA81_06185 [Planctomycetaceae bacterium]|nr:hypothetical protein [Planctomycetaceae bacterium]
MVFGTTSAEDLAFFVEGGFESPVNLSRRRWWRFLELNGGRHREMFRESGLPVLQPNDVRQPFVFVGLDHDEKSRPLPISGKAIFISVAKQ